MTREPAALSRRCAAGTWRSYGLATLPLVLNLDRGVRRERLGAKGKLAALELTFWQQQPAAQHGRRGRRPE